MSQQPLPAPPPPTAPPSRDVLKLNNIQGDILSGLPKKTETWYFFQITNATKFRKDLRQLIPEIKTVADVLEDRKKIEKHKREHDPYKQRPVLIPLVGVNISFSHFGFAKLGIDDAKLGDAAFLQGQLAGAEALKDKGTGTGSGFVPDWDEPFKQKIHGVIIVAGDSHLTVNKKLNQIKDIFDVGQANSSIKELTSIQGDARPGDLSAHEHFGYLDGVSNPAIIGFDTVVPPGPKPIRSGAIITGHDGDLKKADRLPWQTDGSFLVFRHLFQKVPEFDDFLERKALQGPGMSKKDGADLLGARLVGRWKSGAPVDISPFDDDKDLGGDPQRNNNFHFTAERNFQKLCPFAAHVRKTLPRADIEALPGGDLEKNRIMRRGIQFGPEVTKQEKKLKKTLHGRGLLFACYQSSITDGFQFIQQSWANNATFPPEQTPEEPGLDPIIGQGVRKLSGYDPNDPTKVLELDDLWVVPRGGEYFFSPSIKGLTDTIAA